MEDKSQPSQGDQPARFMPQDYPLPDNQETHFGYLAIGVRDKEKRRKDDDYFIKNYNPRDYHIERIRLTAWVRYQWPDGSPRSDAHRHPVEYPTSETYDNKKKVKGYNQPTTDLARLESDVERIAIADPDNGKRTKGDDQPIDDFAQIFKKRFHDSRSKWRIIAEAPPPAARQEDGIENPAGLRANNYTINDFPLWGIPLMNEIAEALRDIRMRAIVMEKERWTDDPPTLAIDTALGSITDEQAQAAIEQCYQILQKHNITDISCEITEGMP